MSTGGRLHHNRGLQYVLVLNSGGEIADVLNGRARDHGHGLFCEECLVAGHERIRKGQEPRDYIIRNDLVGQVFEEELRLLFVDVEADGAQMT